MPPSAKNKKLLDELVGMHVRVAIVPDGYSRNNFDPQISTAGTLESKDDATGNGRYRVLHDNDNFAYFDFASVVLVNTLASVPTITLSIPVSTAERN